jgi:adenylate cyclase
MESVDIPEELGEERVSGGRSAAALSGRARARAIVLAGLAGAALPLVGLVSLLLRSRLDPHFENYRLHFLVFGLVGAVAFSLGYAAGEAANRRGDARVLLLSLAFMATGGFLGLHALGTQGILFSEELSGFQVAIPVGLLVSAVFAAGSAFVDLRPGIAPLLIRRRTLLRVAVLIAMGVWFVWTVAEMPPLRGQGGEAATDGVLAVMAVVGTVVYALSAAPVLAHLPSRLEPAAGGRHRLLPAAVRGDDRRRGHRRAQLACKLVGVARPDRDGLT